MKHYEVNFDGLVGPTHNYAGLSFGNVASLSNAKNISNPKEAAKQGLAKMKSLTNLGIIQGVLAPQERPDLTTLRRLGFTGANAKVLEKAAQQSPEALLACYSASSMWTANAATISPSADTQDGRVHITPANLIDKFHRSIEPDVTGAILKATLRDSKYFVHHRHLPSHPDYGDEGAANHTRLCSEYGFSGLEIFVYGRSAHQHSLPYPTQFPARQTLEASQAVARLHRLDEETALFVQQNPHVIDQGVFHNDVISVGNQNVLLFHEQAFVDAQRMCHDIQDRLPDTKLHLIEVSEQQVSLTNAIHSYLFNTQIVTLPDGTMTIIAPTDCQENPQVKQFLDELLERNTPIQQVNYFDLKQSMRNGGGPACLRLRVAMNEQEVAAINPHTILTETLFNTLNAWIDKHYRDRLSFEDLSDPYLLTESYTALDELTQILKLGSIYPFQQMI